MVTIINQEVQWTANNLPICGTITRPKDENPHVAVVFVAGSGPTDRDWCSPFLPGKNGSAKLLAETLAQNGYITLRYDKIASGPHAAENVPKMIGKVSMQSHVTELSGAVETLVKERGVEKNNIFVLTSSEGAVHALNYQMQAAIKFKGLILTGAPGRSIGEVAREQIANQLVPLPNGAAILKQYDTSIAAFSKGEPINPDPTLTDGIKNLLLALETPVNMPFTRELWNYAPSEYISKIQAPILVVIGKKDIQANWQADGKALENATKASEVSFVYPENADHVLKHEETPAEKLNANIAINYNVDGRKLDDDAVNAILSWLSTHS
ncbi:MAG: alpha/beta hydrolase family protein [Candidatus Bathyarchaeia archaeon]|jgi:pimeloyl-ACP methyl ester carboxylesterase